MCAPLPSVSPTGPVDGYSDGFRQECFFNKAGNFYRERPKSVCDRFARIHNIWSAEPGPQPLRVSLTCYAKGHKKCGMIQSGHPSELTSMKTRLVAWALTCPACSEIVLEKGGATNAHKSRWSVWRDAMPPTALCTGTVKATVSPP